MQVILKPVAQDEPGEIIINDDLFAIGRHEKPFSDYEPRLVEKLSRRHARIFEQDGVVYIADLGSLNGTSVNGEAVDSSPRKLERGDEICFSNRLCYRIEILGSAAKQAAEPAGTPPLRLILTPEKQKDILEPIVVTRFPFLVNKASEVFAKYRAVLPEETGYISRRHAHIFLRGQDVWIEDLGSTNGTFVSGERLEEHARKLEEGDVVAFGGKSFVYRVGLQRSGEEETRKPEDGDEPLTATARAVVDEPTRTTFVTSANSFLDIFCTEDQPPAEAEAGNAPGAAAMPAQRPASGLAARLERPRTLLRELRSAFSGAGKKPSRAVWAVLLVAVLAGLGLYYRMAPGRALEALMQQGRYAEAARRAGDYLAARPGETEFADLATEAVLKAVVPGWLDHVRDAAFDAAREDIARGRRLGSANPQAGQVFASLAWLTGLEHFIAGRGGADAPLQLFAEEERIRTLVDGWESDAQMHRRSFTLTARHVPAFSATRAKALSDLRTLQNYRSLYLAAIERLLERMNAGLDRGDIVAVQESLENFRQKYPRIAGTRSLQDDLEKYRRLREEMEAKRWLQARQLAQTTAFETPFFRQRVRSLSQGELPPPVVAERYQAAQRDWKQGDIDQAMSALEALSQERWGEVAQRWLQRNRAVLEARAALEQSRGKPGYDRQLLAFHRMLDPDRDRYFSASVEEEFQVHRRKVAAEAEQLVASGREAWKGYRDRGGIRALHRLEAELSSAYRKRAARLSEAFDSTRQAMEIYRLLKLDYPPGLARQFARISNEVRLQRQSLTELAMVLEPSLRRAKLELLPQAVSSPAADGGSGGGRYGD